MSHARSHPNWTPIQGEREESREDNCVTRLTLFVGHREDAMPAGRRLIEEVFLAPLPIRARGTIIGPFVQNALERFLSVFPAALAIELMGLTEEVEAVANFVWSAIDRALRGKADEFEDGYRLELAFPANEIRFWEVEAVVLHGSAGCFFDQTIPALTFFLTFSGLRFV